MPALSHGWQADANPKGTNPVPGTMWPMSECVLLYTSTPRVILHTCMPEGRWSGLIRGLATNGRCSTSAFFTKPTNVLPEYTGI